MQQHPLVRQADHIRKTYGMRTGRLLERAGLNNTALSYWRRGGNPTLANFEAFLNAMGYHLEMVREVEGDQP